MGTGWERSRYSDSRRTWEDIITRHPQGDGMGAWVGWGGRQFLENVCLGKIREERVKRRLRVME